MTRNNPRWYKDAVIYQVDVRSFMDSNNDGVGDFRGLIDKLDYLDSLGVTALWLMPFYPSQGKDGGYDVTDYRSIDPSLGTMEDFRALIAEAHSRSIRVVVDLVLNHTSVEHPWFKRAVAAPKGSTERDYYVWSESNQKFKDTPVLFSDSQESNWTWHNTAKAYYWHRFYPYQPDLNYDNPAVVKEIIQIMTHWLDTGVDGIRLDSVPYLVERKGTQNANLPETHTVIKKLKDWVRENYADRMLLAVANEWPEDVVKYFGENGDECDMAYNFPVQPRLFMALAMEDRHPVVDIMRQTPDIDENNQWALFLSNHDELSLDSVTKAERKVMLEHYCDDPRARRNNGICRRLSPMMKSDRRKTELLYSFLFSLPGTPILYYGDEIGMGDNVYLPDRDGVRTPMQWSPDRNGGFSKADPAKLFLPSVMDSVYGYQTVNVESAQTNPSSLLNWVKRIIAVRQAHRVFGQGKIDFLPSDNRRVLSYLRRGKKETILCVANLSDQPQHVELDLSEFEGRIPVELIGSCRFPAIGEWSYQITMPEHGFFWFLLAEPSQAAIVGVSDARDYTCERDTLVLPEGWRSLLNRKGWSVKNFENVMRGILPDRRWYGAKGEIIEKIEIDDQFHVKETGDQLFTVISVHLQNGDVHSYFLPLSIDWEAATDDEFKGDVRSIYSRVRQNSTLGTLYDGVQSHRFATRVVREMGAGLVIRRKGGAKIVFSCNKYGKSIIDKLPKDAYEKMITGEQSNSSVIVGDDMIIKFYRRVAEGLHPEVATCRYLTEVAKFKNAPPYYGVVESIGSDGEPTALAILQGFVENQGDGWNNTLGYLTRFFEDVERVTFSEPVSGDSGRHSIFLGTMQTLGKRTAEMHKAFAVGGDPAFDPEPAKKADVKSWVKGVHEQAERTCKALQKRVYELDPALRKQVTEVLENWQRVTNLIDELAPDELEMAKTRYHGDYHLGQVVVADGDFYLMDFEGEPLKPLMERHIKTAQMKDVAGMVRSFNYAAWGTLFNYTEHKPEAKNTLLPWVQDWEKRAVAAFLDGYEKEIAGCAGYPQNKKTATNLLNLFILEKALYEVVYEVANRPDWLPIPLMGVRRLIGLEKEN